MMMLWEFAPIIVLWLFGIWLTYVVIKEDIKLW